MTPAPVPEGERWAAEELRALRSDGFMPRACVRFLSASFQRAALTRHERPDLSRQSRTWAARGLVAGMAACMGAHRANITAPAPLTWALWWLSTAAMLDWHLGMVEGAAGEHRSRLSPADAATLLRLAFVPFIAAQTARRRDAMAFTSLLATAAATDLADGALARRYGATRLGRDLDTMADVLVGWAGVRAARRAGWIAPGPARLALARHALPVAVITLGYLRNGQRPPRVASGATRWTAPALLGGLGISPAAPRAADRLITIGSLAALVMACLRRRAT